MGDRNGLNIRNMRVSMEESKVFGKGFRSKQRILGEVGQHKVLIEEQEKLAREYKGLSVTTSGDGVQKTKYVKVFVAGCEIQMPADQADLYAGFEEIDEQDDISIDPDNINYSDEQDEEGCTV